MTKTLILQFIIKQWDKAETTEQHIAARRAMPDRYPVKIPPAKSLFDERVIIDQHGDDLLGNRLQYQIIDNTLLIDRFRFDLNTQVVEFKTELTADSRPEKLTTLDNGWQQFHYQWRYRVKHNDQIFWLYESVCLNAVYSACFNEELFIQSLPSQTFNKVLKQVG